MNAVTALSATGFDLRLLAAASTLALVSVRFLGLFLSMPLLSFRAFPLSLRVAPVLLLSVVVAPLVEN